MTNNHALLFHNKIKFRYEIGVVTVAVKHIMFAAAGLIDVPE